MHHGSIRLPILLSLCMGLPQSFPKSFKLAKPRNTLSLQRSIIRSVYV
jgi:hypothetical protein